jgi:predicted metal-dependent phosphoesterase TrpH
MIPPLIVEAALSKGIELIAITDHNSSANYESVKKAAENTPLVVLPGMELQTREEVHTLCLFENRDQIIEFQQIVDNHLPLIRNNPDHFGEQFVVNETGEFIRREDRLLLSSSTLSLSEAFAIVENLHGLFIPAHVNRKAYGLIENLGFIPRDISIEAVEISKHLSPEKALAQFPQLKGYPIIQNGDVHRLDEFLGTLTLFIEKPSIPEIKKALANVQGRFFQVEISDNTI